METFLVILIVGLAAAYTARTYFRVWKKKGARTCGCTSCDAKPTSSNTFLESSQFLNEKTFGSRKPSCYQ